MAASKLIGFPTGQLRISRVVYFTDLIHSDAREIPIGVIAEIVIPSFRGIGAALCASLDPDDEKLVGPLARKMLKKPIDFFWPTIRESFLSSPPGTALDSLTDSYSGSINILAPFALPVPRQLLLPAPARIVKERLKDRLRVTLTDAYYELFFPPRDRGPKKPALQEEISKAA